MPGLTYKANGLELGLGDFVIFASLAAHSARRGAAPLVAASVGVVAGLVPTLFHLSIVKRRTVVPALPLSVTAACILLALEGFVLRPFAEFLAERALVL
mmetsp:Transcript_26587/g.60141  ORF Transcript_26587/g.60141 Transcript_26587/m.60141 type:complete len:99 (+) Transcript_26587:439-735(+)